MNITLIGMRGAGKSNVSRRLAVLTKRPVMSTDTLIEYEDGGRTINDFIAETGDWRTFREREYEVVRKVCDMDGTIIDAGGGVVVDLDEAGEEVYSARKIELLRAGGPIVWLRGDLDHLVAKVEAKANRPSLDLRTSTRALMERRLPFYERAADIIIDVRGKRRQILALEILDRLGPDAVLP